MHDVESQQYKRHHFRRHGICIDGWSMYAAPRTLRLEHHLEMVRKSVGEGQAPRRDVRCVGWKALHVIVNAEPCLAGIVWIDNAITVVCLKRDRNHGGSMISRWITSMQSSPTGTSLLYPRPGPSIEEAAEPEISRCIPHSGDESCLFATLCPRDVPWSVKCQIWPVLVSELLGYERKGKTPTKAPTPTFCSFSVNSSLSSIVLVIIEASSMPFQFILPFR